ncbi:MAG: ThuA domain-containing protein [Pirellulales bacterium]|nr:ThuA domain-containing protein [Pirellulales bacterium]
MERRTFLKSTGAAAGLSLLPTFARAADDDAGQSLARKRLLMFTRSAGFQHSVINRKDVPLGHAERILTELGRGANIEVLATKDGRIFDSADFDQFDGYFFYTTGDLTRDNSADKSPPMSAAGKERFLKAVAGGKGLVGSHCASDTFHSQGPARENQATPDPYIATLGGEFISHGAQQRAKQLVADAKFPGAEKLGDVFEVEEEWYALKNFAPNLHVVLVMETAGMDGGDYQRPPFPCTWARQHEQGRVFYTSLGHREDVWTNEKFHALVLGGLNWALGRVDADVTPNLNQVTPEASKLS